MTRLEVREIDPIADPRWDAFVEGHPFGWISQTSGWARVLTRSFKHLKPRFLAAFDSSGALVAGLPLFEVRSRLLGNRWVSVPFATLSDPLVSNRAEFGQLLEAALGRFEGADARFLEVRCCRAGELAGRAGLGRAGCFRHHFLILDGQPRLSRGNLRRAVARAEGEFEVRKARNEEDLRTYYALYLRNRRRLSLPPLPYRFFLNQWRELGEGFQLLLAEREGELAAGLCLLRFGRRVSGDCAAWDDRYRNSFPGHLLWWRAIEEAADEGFDTFDFGRTHYLNQGLMDFKRRWDTEVAELPVFFHPSEHAAGLEKRESSFAFRGLSLLCRYSPEPLLRGIGEFCYMHSS